MCRILFLKQKSEVPGVFLKFKAGVENEDGYIIQTLRYDNSKFESFMKLEIAEC